MAVARISYPEIKSTN